MVASGRHINASPIALQVARITRAIAAECFGDASSADATRQGLFHAASSCGQASRAPSVESICKTFNCRKWSRSVMEAAEQREPSSRDYGAARNLTIARVTLHAHAKEQWLSSSFARPLIIDGNESKRTSYERFTLFHALLRHLYDALSDHFTHRS
jgi:hypothetical protein